MVRHCRKNQRWYMLLVAFQGFLSSLKARADELNIIKGVMIDDLLVTLAGMHLLVQQGHTTSPLWPLLHLRRKSLTMPSLLKNLLSRGRGGGISVWCSVRHNSARSNFRLHLQP